VPTGEPLLRLSGIAKRFGAVQALGGVDLELRSGEVHALLGENGAGKSTLIRVVAGAHAPDAGTLEVRGEPVREFSPRHAAARGIAVLHQHSTLFDELSVAENLFFGRDGAWIDWRARRARARAALSELRAVIDPDERCGALGPAQRKEVELARALLAAAPILVLDEPTAVLPAREAERLLATIARLSARGVGVLLISHRLEEVERVADRLSVLRDGRSVWCGAAGTIGRDELVRHMVGRPMVGRPMVGRSVPAAGSGSTGRAGAPVLVARGLGSKPLGLSGIDLALHAGEVLGLGGLVGAGRSELARCLFGLERLDAGTLELGGRPFRPRAPREAIERGLVLVPEDRARDGLVLAASVRENAALPWLERLARAGLVVPRRERELAERAVRAMDVRAGLEARAGELSGGNQQKLVLGKWLGGRKESRRDGGNRGDAEGAEGRGGEEKREEGEGEGKGEWPRVLVLDEPTQGVDVAGRAEIHERVRALARGGTAVLLISSDLQELLALSDRIAVLRRGVLVGMLAGEEKTGERVLGLALGAAEDRA
jgi:ABC-type sugar transport system ATPase subunit